MALKAIDWNKCCICEKNTNEELTCPALHKSLKLQSAGYKTFVENLKDFQRINALPLALHKFIDNEDLEETLKQNNAKWHKTCSLTINKTQLERAKKRKRSSYLPNVKNFDSTEKRTKLLHSSEDTSENQDTCFICKKAGSIRKQLVQMSSLQVEKLRASADITDNLDLKKSLSEDSFDLKRYHKKCFITIKNHLQPRNSLEKDGEVSSTCEGIAFACVVRFIRQKMSSADGKENADTFFKMSELNDIYVTSLSNVLELESERISNHSTRLRERILNHFPELKSQLVGREYILYAIETNILKRLCINNDDDAVASFLKQIRKDMSRFRVSFSGHLKGELQSESVPPSLLALVNRLLHGSHATGISTKANQSALTISQLILFNYKENVPKGKTTRQKSYLEPPLPLYMGLSVYGRTRNNTIIETMHERGISISPNRIKEITASLSTLVIQRSQEEGVLCPSNLLHGLFTIGAYDNIDHNYTSTGSESSFHGTALSIFQIPAKGDIGTSRDYIPAISIFEEKKRTVPELPDTYSVVKSIALPLKQPKVPKCLESTRIKMETLDINSEWKKEQEWLDHTLTDTSETKNLSWSAFHASKEDASSIEPSLNSLLPLFNESSSSPAMMLHGMEQIKQITTFLNPGQVPVICLDQPLYTLSKLIQWNWPDLYGESKFVVMFAPFHIEQAFLKVLGQILQGSGWTSVLANSGIKTEAGAEAVLKVTHVTKARAIHQITAAVLYRLLLSAFHKKEDDVSFENWLEQKLLKSPTFRFWFLTLNLEILLLSFVRSIRQGNYQLYLQTLKKMTPWFFLMDHCHYARWLPVHIKDLEELKYTAPKVHDHFCKGQFVVHKSKNPFSALAVDQAHEQNNAVIKGDGGAIGLLQDPAMLRRWMLAGPELVGILSEFETESTTNSDKKAAHHEQCSAFQNKFHDKIQKMEDSFLEFSNPFENNSSELLVWDTKVVMDDERVKHLAKAEEKALSLYNEYVNERLSKDMKVSVFAPIPKNKTKLFSFTIKKNSSATITDLRNDVELFSRAFIVSQNRELDIDKFFEYENTSAPPSVSSNGVLRTCQKSQLTKILEETIDSQPRFDGVCDAIVYDGAALVHSLPPKVSRTFKEYCNSEFKNRLLNDIERFQGKRIHISWDSYSDTCLKKTIRVKTGSGIRRQIDLGNPLPKDWNDFLLCDQNKTNLFKLLGEYTLSMLTQVQIITEVDGIFRSSRLESTSVNGVKYRTQEEADGRIFLHVKDSVEHGAKKVLICTVDTDVLVLAVSFFFKLKSAGLIELWLLFGTGRSQRCININAVVESMNENTAVALRGFHAFTGSDVTSSFSLKGKQSAWKTWKSFPEVTQAFLTISAPQKNISEGIFELLEKFVVLLYHKGSEEFSINHVRKILFTSKNRNIHSLPPTKEALRQHCLRSAYQAGQVWGQACSVEANIPEPEGWGWTMIDGVWTPVWSSLPSIWEACRELVKCSCSGSCGKRCSCAKAKIPCTLLCSNCSGSERWSNKYNKRVEPNDEEWEIE